MWSWVRPVFLSLVGVAWLGGCQRHDPPGTGSARPVDPAAPSVTAAASARARAPKPSASAAAAPSKPKDPALARLEARRPVALDEAAKRKADAYLVALGGGRKATLAKAYDRAEALFTKCLEVTPGDPRALSERGYARLLAGKPSEADTDFAAAAAHAPNSLLLQQILHNRALAAQQRGDEAKAREFSAAEREQKAARRIAPGVDCTVSVSPISVPAERASSLADAWRRMGAAHVLAAHENPSFEPKPEELTLRDAPVLAGSSEADLWQRMTGGAPRDGAWVVVSDAPDGITSGEHLLFSKSGQLFLRPNQAFTWIGRCGPSGGKVEVGGGGGTPWHATVLDSESYAAYMCEWPDGKYAPCGSREGEGNPVQSYCTWISHREELVIYDAQSFEGLVSITAQAAPRDLAGEEPVTLIDADYQPTKVIIRACGTRREVPYALGSSPASSTAAAP